MAADAAAVLKRLAEAKSARTIVEQHWRDCYDLTYPMRGSAMGLDNPGAATSGTADSRLSNGLDRQAQLYDSTGADAVRVLASQMVTGTTPSSSRWIELKLDDVDDEGTQFLEKLSELTWLNIHASGFDPVAFEAMLDTTVAGCPALYVEEAPPEATVPYAFDLWPMASTYYATTRSDGVIDTVYREYTLTAEQAMGEFGALTPEKVREQAMAKPDATSTYVQAIYPRTDAKPGSRLARNLPFASCTIHVESKKIVRERGYHEFPVVVPRWMKLPGSVYATGAVSEALPDLRTLNEIVGMVLQNADLAIAGMWGAADDGVLNPKTVKIGARKIVMMASKDSMWPLQPATNFDVSAMEIDRLQRTIRRCLMADQLQPQDGPAMTATEVSVRVQLVRQILGPVYGRLFHDYLQRLVERCVGIALRSGVLGIPPKSVQGREPRIEYENPLARSQRATDVQAMDLYEGAIGAQAGAGLTDAVDLYDWDESRRHRARLLGVPARLIPDADSVAQVRKQRQEAAAAAAQQAQQQQLLAGVAAGAQG